MDTKTSLMGKHHKLHDKQKKAQTDKENINITDTD